MTPMTGPARDAPMPMEQTYENDLMSIYLQEKKQQQQYLYVISGFCESALSTVERMNLSTMQWESLEGKLCHPRTKFQAVLLSGSENKVLLFGGKNSKAQRIDTVE